MRTTRTVSHPRWPGFRLSPQDRRVMREGARLAASWAKPPAALAETPFLRAITQWGAAAGTADPAAPILVAPPPSPAGA